MTNRDTNDQVVAPTTRTWPPRRTDRTPQYEYRTVTFSRDTPRDETRRLLTEHAEYGRWELARSVVYYGGERKVVLRRRYVEVRATIM